MIPLSFVDELEKIAAFNFEALLGRFGKRGRAASTALPADLSNRLARVQRTGAAAVDRAKVNLANLQMQARPERQRAIQQLAEMKRQRGLM